MAKKKKSAKIKNRPQDISKKARGQKKAESIESRLFSLHLGYLDLDGPFGWKDIGIEKLKEILYIIRSYESMTWSEIKKATHGFSNKSKNHFIPICECSREAQKRYMECFDENIAEDEVFSLRLSNKERIFGIVTKGVFKALWWDPEHKVYKSKKR